MVMARVTGACHPQALLVCSLLFGCCALGAAGKLADHLSALLLANCCTRYLGCFHVACDSIFFSAAFSERLTGPGRRSCQPVRPWAGALGALYAGYSWTSPWPVSGTFALGGASGICPAAMVFAALLNCGTAEACNSSQTLMLTVSARVGPLYCVHIRFQQVMPVNILAGLRPRAA